MVFTIQANNQILASGGGLEIKFPSSLDWQRDISTNHQLPIGGTLTCNNLTSNVLSTLSCSGLTSTQVVTVSNVFASDIGSGDTISFDIDGLFSPPTT